MTRIDQLLVQRGLAPTRSAAQRLVEADTVQWLGPHGWSAVRKAGLDVPAQAQLRVLDDAETRWVSRGGLKLEGALMRCADLPVAGAWCLDVGQSTGGFTDVLLAQGAHGVVGIDVGHGQLHARLRDDPRVTALEHINARELTAERLGEMHAPVMQFDLIVGDLSFISQTLVLPALASLLKPGAALLMLVRPQFELQAQHIGKGGLVKDSASYGDVEQRLRSCCASLGLQVLDYFESVIAGGDGNREFFIRAYRPDRP